MKVTPQMHLENGEKVSKLADLISEEGDGIQLTREYGLVMLRIETFSLNSRSVRIHPDDVAYLIRALRQVRMDAREMYPDEPKATGFPWLRDGDGNAWKEEE